MLCVLSRRRRRQKKVVVEEEGSNLWIFGIDIRFRMNVNLVASAVADILRHTEGLNIQ